ncbi:MAG: HEAT repeat domain-containing protein [Terriglobales bacterium]
MLWWTLLRLRSTDSFSRWKAATRLGESGDLRALRPLVVALGDRAIGVRQAAKEALDHIDPDWANSEAAKRTIPTFVAALHSKDLGAQIAAAYALGWSRDPRAIEPLLAVLTDMESTLRNEAKEALDRIDPEWAKSEAAKRAIPAMVAKLSCNYWQAEHAAAVALGWNPDARAVEPLVAALRHDDAGVREAAAHALGCIGDARAFKPLLAVLKDKQVHVWKAAKEALGKVADVRSVETLVTLLDDKQRTGRSDRMQRMLLRWAAAYALGCIGDARAVEPLLAALKDEDHNVRVEAKEALDRIEPGWAKSEAAKRAIPMMVAALNDKEREVRQAAAYALERIEPDRANSNAAKRAIPPMVAERKDEVSNMQEAAPSVSEDTRLGILFEIDELDGLYGYEAYKIFFDAVDSASLEGCTLSDGDTNATLARRANQYCIAVDSLDAAKVAAVKNALTASNARGLLPLSSRFLPGAALSSEPLVIAARIEAGGRLVECKTGWVLRAWEKSRETHQASAPSV